MISLPFESSGKWSVKHGLDFMADIVNTRNMDFTRPGYARAGKKPTVIFTKDQSSDFGSVMALVPISTGTSTTHYIITNQKAWKWSPGTSNPTVLSAISVSFGFDSDGVAFNGLLHASGNGTVSSYNDGADTWTNRVSSLSTSYPMPLCAGEHQPYLAVGNQNTVKLYDTSYSLIVTLTLPAQYIVTGIRFQGSNYCIATRAIGGASAKLFLWNGSGSAAQSDYTVRADWIYSLVEFDSSICVLTSKGQLLRFNGGGFDELAHFPVYNSPLSWTSNAALTNSTGRCANRGMIADGDRLYINIDGRVNSPQTDAPGPFLVNQPSGLWIFDKDVGLYHRAGYCASQYQTASFTLASSHFVFSAAHNLQTGDPVLPTNTTGLTGVVLNQLHYAIVDGSNSIRLARSRTEALAGTSISVTGAPSGATLVFDTFDMLGAVFTQTFPGAVGLFLTTMPPSILGSEAMYAGTVTKADGTTTSSLMTFGSSHGRSSFTTSPLPAAGATDNFQRLRQFIDGLALDDEQIVPKYRLAPRFGLPTQYHRSSAGVATWVDSTHFTIDPTTKDFSAVAVKDEVEIIEGAGAGYTAHIANIDNSTSTWTITLDEAIPGISAAQQSEVIVDNWTKLHVITNKSQDIVRQFDEATIDGASGSTIQFKVEIRGMPGLGVRKLQSMSADNKP